MEEKRKISAKTLVADVRAGMTASELMSKHDFSKASLDKALDKLKSANLLSDRDIDTLQERSHPQELPWTFKCPKCGLPQNQKAETCQDCGVIFSRLKAEPSLSAVSSEDNTPSSARRGNAVWIGICITLPVLLLIGSLVWIHEDRAALRRAEIEQLQRIEALKLRQAEVAERARQAELQRVELGMQQESQEMERQLQAHMTKAARDAEQFRKAEAKRTQEVENQKRREQRAQEGQRRKQAARDSQAKQGVREAYSNMARVIRDMMASFLGGDVMGALPALKIRLGDFQDRLSELKSTPGVDPRVVGHLERASQHLMAMFGSSSEGGVRKLVDMWMHEVSQATTLMRGGGDG